MSTEAPSLEVLDREAWVEEGRRRRPPASPRVGRRTWTVLAGLAVAGSLVHAGLGRRDVVNPGGWGLVRDFLVAALRPELDPAFLWLAADAALTTVAYGAAGTALAAVLGLVGGVLVSEVWWRPAAEPGRRRAGAWTAARTGLALPRGVHEAVWALLLVAVLGLDPLVGVLAIGLPYGAVTAKVVSEILDEAPRAPFLALRRAGAPRLQALAYSLLPQTLPDVVSYLFYRFECSIRAATILGVIGAGGLGFQLALSFQSLRHPEIWTLLYVLVAVGGLADWWGSRVRARLGAGPPVRTPAGTGAGTGDRVARSRLLVGSWVGAAVLVGVSVGHLGLDARTLWSERTRELGARLASDLLPPDLVGRLGELAWASVETLSMSVAAVAVATVLAVAAALVAARPREGAGPGRRAMAGVTRSALLFARAVPPPLWALLLLFVLFPGPLPGAMALAVYNAGVLGRLAAEAVENLDPRPADALRSLGAGEPAVALYAVLPRLRSRLAGLVLYRWEVTIRETVVVGLVGAGGLGRLLAEELARFDYGAVAGTLVALVALTVAVDLVGARLRRALR